MDLRHPGLIDVEYSRDLFHRQLVKVVQGDNQPFLRAEPVYRVGNYCFQFLLQELKVRSIADAVGVSIETAVGLRFNVVAYGSDRKAVKTSVELMELVDADFQLVANFLLPGLASQLMLKTLGNCSKLPGLPS